MDQHQPVVDEAVDDIVDHPLPAEEDRAFLALERTQSWIGPLGQQVCAGGAAVKARPHRRRVARRRARSGTAIPSRAGVTSKRAMPKGATSIGRASPDLSSTAQGGGAPRAPIMRSRSSTPMAKRSSTKRSSFSIRTSASASHRLAASMRSLGLLHSQGFETRADDRLAVIGAMPSPLSAVLDLGASGFGVRRRVKIEARRPAAVPSGGGRLLRLRLFGHAVPQLAQPLGEPYPQPTELLIVLLVIGLPKLKATRVAGRGIVEREARHRVAALVQQEVRARALVSVRCALITNTRPSDPARSRI